MELILCSITSHFYAQIDIACSNTGRHAKDPTFFLTISQIWTTEIHSQRIEPLISYSWLCFWCDFKCHIQQMGENTINAMDDDAQDIVLHGLWRCKDDQVGKVHEIGDGNVCIHFFIQDSSCRGATRSKDCTTWGNRQTMITMIPIGLSTNYERNKSRIVNIKLGVSKLWELATRFCTKFQLC